MFTVATGIASDPDHYAAGLEATSAAQKQMKVSAGKDTSVLVLVFVSASFHIPSVLKGIRSIVGPDALIAGASTAGEITNAGPSARESVAVMILESNTITFSVAVEEGIEADSAGAGKRLGEKLKSDMIDPKIVSMFADGLRGNGSAIIRGLNDVLGADFPIVGGSAGDDGKFVQTYQIANDSVYSDAVVGVAFGGPLAYSVGINHGWTPVGAPRTVTKADGVKVQTVDDKAAVSLYEEYLGAKEVENLKTQTLGEIALSYPLGIRADGSDEMLLRAPFAVGEDGSIVCGGEVPEGVEIQLMVGTKEDAVNAAHKAAVTALDGLEGATPEAAIIFSCHVRNRLYGASGAAEDETRKIQETIGLATPLAGFYTYAEQAPVGGASRNIKKCNPEFHNETVVLVLLSEIQ